MIEQLKSFIKCYVGQINLEIMMMFIRHLQIILGVLVCWVPTAYACSCARPIDDSPEYVVRDIEQSAAVFSGKVLDAKQDAMGVNSISMVVVTFDVTKQWKGAASKQLKLRTRSAEQSCGYRFQVGEEYLVFTYKDYPLETGLCTRTKQLRDAKLEIRVLDKLVLSPR